MTLFILLSYPYKDTDGQSSASLYRVVISSAGFLLGYCFNQSKLYHGGRGGGEVSEVRCRYLTLHSGPRSNLPIRASRDYDSIMKDVNPNTYIVI